MVVNLALRFLDVFAIGLERVMSKEHICNRWKTSFSSILGLLTQHINCRQSDIRPSKFFLQLQMGVRRSLLRRGWRSREEDCHVFKLVKFGISFRRFVWKYRLNLLLTPLEKFWRSLFGWDVKIFFVLCPKLVRRTIVFMLQRSGGGSPPFNVLAELTFSYRYQRLVGASVKLGWIMR